MELFLSPSLWIKIICKFKYRMFIFMIIIKVFSLNSRTFFFHFFCFYFQGDFLFFCFNITWKGLVVCSIRDSFRIQWIQVLEPSRLCANSELKVFFLKQIKWPVHSKDETPNFPRTWTQVSYNLWISATVLDKMTRGVQLISFCIPIGAHLC